ncbi:hypothetical protein [Amycolatopsis pigmentata]|uniref:Uncharacterized protein n=1 Tax=Amycolatopsis pigmentata TaxID=450801 RepID=A0ABW5G8H5_9PSEU
MPTDKPRRAEQNDEGKTNGYRFTALAGRALSDWGTTARLIATLVAILAVLVVGAGLFGLNVDVGPVHLTRH